MIEFLAKNFNFITYGLEFLAALTGIICLKNYINSSTKYFIFFLIYIFIIEVLGASLVYYPDFYPVYLIRRIGFQMTNWYNIFWFFGSIVFVLYYFYSLLQLKQNKFIIKIVGILFSLIMLGHFIIYFDVFMSSHPKLYQFLGLLATFISIALYFIEFLKSDSMLNIFKTFGFYASIGLFLWWLIITPVIFFDFYNTEADWHFVNLKRLIFLFANAFMYSTFTFALMYCKPENRGGTVN